MFLLCLLPALCPSDDLLQHSADTVMKDKIGRPFHFCPAFIDNDHMPAVEHMGQLGSGSYFQRSPSDDQCICPADHFYGIGIGRLGKEFSVESHIRPYRPAACRAAGNRIRAVENKILVIESPAGCTVVRPDRSVDLLDISAPSLLMETVYILCDNAGNPSGQFQLSQGFVSPVGQG